MISINCFFFQGRMIAPNTSLKTVKKTKIGCTSMNLHNVYIQVGSMMSFHLTRPRPISISFVIVIDNWEQWENPRK